MPAGTPRKKKAVGTLKSTGKGGALCGTWRASSGGCCEQKLAGIESNLRGEKKGNNPLLLKRGGEYDQSKKGGEDSSLSGDGHVRTSLISLLIWSRQFPVI